MNNQVSLRDRLVVLVREAFEALVLEGFLPSVSVVVSLVPPKQANHGDFACTLAMSLAKAAGKSPREIAERLREKVLLSGGDVLEKVEVAGPGYLNLYVCASVWRGEFGRLLRWGGSFIESNRGQGEKVLLEYVSANPTGPLHIAHGRGAVTGDVVARLMRAAGYDVTREYYINDLGHQADVMARSVYLRYAELLGRPFEAPEDFYPGDYIIDVARAVLDVHGGVFLDAAEEVWLPVMRQQGIEAMLGRIRGDLERFGIVFDQFVSERALSERAGLDAMLERLKAGGHTYVEEGKVWFKSSAFGDDKDRVMVREDGRPTYFATDVLYHHDKLQRGFARLINVWGADHGGYVARVKAALGALGYDPEVLKVILIQMVSLSRGGEAVRMGKRLGTAVWLKDILDEAGKDATRYFFIMRRSDAQMDFDVQLATEKSNDNPVFYAQMGHARMCAIARKAEALGVQTPVYEEGILDALVLPEELALIKTVLRAPEVVADAAAAYEPHLVVFYLQDLITQFHSYYTQYKGTERVVSDDVSKTHARLLLCHGLKLVMRALLVDILGVEAPTAMSLSDVE